MSDTTKKRTLNQNMIYVFITVSCFALFMFGRPFVFPLIDIFLGTLCYGATSIIAFISFGWGSPLIAMCPPRWMSFLFPFYLALFILWFNKYISSKIKALFGFDIKGGNLIETRTIENPGVYNVFSDMVTGIGNGFIYIVTLQFLYPDQENA
jgi:hypothetical protein